MLSRNKFVLVFLVWLLLHNQACAPAFAFMTFKWFGGAIHRDILNRALAPLGVGRKSLSTIGKGCDSQDVPLTEKFAVCPQNHCDDDQIKAGRQYWRERVKQAVVDAAHADTDPGSGNKALFEFGEGMHTVHDFYSHANYLEWLLQNDKGLEPVQWDNMPSSIRTGYYYYAGFLAEEAFVSRARSVRGLQKMHTHLDFRTAAEYDARKSAQSYDAALDYALRPGDLLHKELNKDSPRTMEGQIVVPQYGKTLHELARQLATADTARQWKNFEQMIGAAYGARAANIMAALKGHQANGIDR
jgi:hypothetical protein